ncbi:jg3787 [Pararge aegeria aegeria]|uniref:Jg3787 protein n=1 Tax=Pararge aegeria aegeria TaxID=348720 RepID=A0A8S4SQQ9_9NEOP|nr:jg3787 [Pararge aegeria aegeria]
MAAAAHHPDANCGLKVVKNRKEVLVFHRRCQLLCGVEGFCGNSSVRGTVAFCLELPSLGSETTRLQSAQKPSGPAITPTNRGKNCELRHTDRINAAQLFNFLQESAGGNGVMSVARRKNHLYNDVPHLTTLIQFLLGR